MDLAVVLPPEIVEKIFSHLQLRDLLACSEVSVSWYKHVSNVRLWRPFVRGDEKYWLQKYQSKECNNITSNFDDESRGLNAIITADTLLPVNRYKNAIRQRNIIKHNWSHGIFESRTLMPQSCGLKAFSRIEVEYPSLAPQDCLYHPILGTSENGEEGLYLIRLDAEPRIVYKLVENMNGVDAEEFVVCVMRDYVVWVLGVTVQCLALQNGLENSKVQTVGTVCDNEYIFLTMDIDNIIAWSHEWVYVWDKETFELRLHRDLSPETTIRNVCKSDGIIIISLFQYNKQVSTVEVTNISSNIEILHEFELDGRIIDVMCSKDFILFHFYSNGVDRLEGRNKITGELHFLRTFPSGVFDSNVTQVFDSLFIYRSKFVGSVEFDIARPEADVEFRLPLPFNSIKYLFENMLLGINWLMEGRCVEFFVWDWVKNIKLNMQSFSFTMFNINESRLIALDEEGVLRVIAYG
ncbi:hypothetical protein LSTR_LSTR004059 [Laodelphax striatellus]|uniref:F-box domain-containing protein n=1 Tax=Laodelphax striatellus TaxID=195883 RepID=A0A482WG57_LAOST|nr:hypothetical protein LSTR_LSTR004059 [Laodelphax striatellus]